MATILQANEGIGALPLGALRPTQHTELLDVVDQLRAAGLNEHIGLPQLIVVGDQSSGKSSLLSAISGVPFPKKDNLCTRFATEVVLRRDDSEISSRISVSITASSSRPQAERKALKTFQRDLTSIDELPDVTTGAANAMGLGPGGNAFAADILRLVVRGPDLPQLTIVDLPGLIHSENKFQSADDIALVNKLVEDYMAQERSIILAVVSARNDYANQVVLRKTQSIDPRGRRTLGIITKPDALRPGSSNETSFLELAQNRDIHLSLGWHVVRNPDISDEEEAKADPEDLEREFFSTSRMSEVGPACCGIPSLRTGLADILLNQIKRELPGLISEIHLATTEVRQRLERMGHSRDTPTEKLLFVIDLGHKFQALCSAACEGIYEDPFFNDENSSMMDRRLRAVVQNMSGAFRTSMLQAPLQISSNVVVESKEEGARTPLSRANELVRLFRGKELPGTFNPALIGTLFRECRQQWGPMARKHFEGTWIAARKTVVAILDVITEQHVRDASLRSLIDPALKDMRREMNARLEDYLQTFDRHPITYNHYLTETVQKMRRDRDYDAMLKRFEQFVDTKGGRIHHSDGHTFVQSVLPKPEPDMDKVAARDLADFAQAYYKVAIKRAIDEIAAHVLEPSLLKPLAYILAATNIIRLPQDKVDIIASEPEQRRAERLAISAKLEVFERSSIICRIYAESTPAESFSPASSMQGEQDESETESETSSVVSKD